MNMDPSTGTQF